MLVITTVYCVGEWYGVSGKYLFSGAMPVQPGEVNWFRELDWSVAAVLPGPDQGDFGFRMWNAAFGFVNYFVLGLYLAAILTFYAMLIMYSEMFIRLSRGEAIGGLKIIPDVNENDPRRGFGNFERMFRRTLFATMAGFLLCYLMNVQNLFLRSEAAHIGSFVSGDIARGFAIFLSGDFKGGLAKITGELFEVRYIFNVTSVWAAVLVFCIFSLVSLSLAWVLSESAQRGRDDLRLYVRREENPIRQLTSLDRDACIARLETPPGDTGAGMKIWPFGWPSLRQLSLFLLFGGICIVLYRFGLVFLGVGIGWVILNVLGVFKPSR